MRQAAKKKRPTIALLIAFGVLLSIDGPKVSRNQPTPWIGVTERIMLGVVILWIAVLSVALMRGKRGINDGRSTVKT